MYAPVSDILKEIISNFWQTGEIWAKQKGLQYAFEGYIHDIICNRLENNFIKIEAKAYNVRSQRKQQPPHTLTIQMGNTQMEEQLCSCTAG